VESRCGHDGDQKKSGPNLARETNQLHGAVCLETLIVTQLVKKFPAFYATGSVITAFPRHRHSFLPEPDESSSQPPPPSRAGLRTEK
jgi:hypothetical protein